MTPFHVQCCSVALAALGSGNCHRVPDCRDNGDPVQLEFFNVAAGTQLSPLAVVPSTLHDPLHATQHSYDLFTWPLDASRTTVSLSEKAAPCNVEVIAKRHQPGLIKSTHARRAATRDPLHATQHSYDLFTWPADASRTTVSLSEKAAPCNVDLIAKR
jgi:hypothetical protein